MPHSWWDQLEGTTSPTIRARTDLQHSLSGSCPSRDAGELTAVEFCPFPFKECYKFPKEPGFLIGCCLFQVISGRWRSLLVLRLILLLPAAAVVCSLVIDGALIHFIILNTGEFCLPFFFFVLYFGFLSSFFSEYDAPGTYIKLFWSGFVYSNLED